MKHFVNELSRQFRVSHSTVRSGEKIQGIRSSLAKFCLLILVASSFSFTDVSDPEPKLNDIRIERHKAVTMSDGVVLYADAYLPAAPGRYPTLVTRTPYGVQRDGTHEMMVKFAQHGYA